MTRPPKARQRVLDAARRIVEDAPVLAVVLDEQGHVVYANPCCLRLIGHGLDELVGRSRVENCKGHILPC